ncbi:MAG: T9SS type A sorting domain-containing protein [Flavobacteriales bacterium]|nr:T9SS type A sorting domain-containing protein [Flavobacteriales bacterium]
MRGSYSMRLLVVSALLMPMVMLAQRGTPVPERPLVLSKSAAAPMRHANKPASEWMLPYTAPPIKSGRLTTLTADDRQGGPVNDDCAGATTVTMGTSCVPTTGTTAGASSSLTAITCNTFTGDADDDVWYKFTATAASATIRVDGDLDFDAVVDLRSGACNGTNIGCADATVEDGIEQIVVGGLTIGALYYVRVYDYYTGPAPTPGFTICVFNTPGAPANDQCFNVVPQTLNIGGVLNFSGTTAGATVTNDALPLSDFDDAIPKVWHAFTINSCANVTMDYCGTSPAFDQVYIAVVGACPANTGTLGAFDFTTCLDGNGTVEFIGLPAGTYYIPIGQFGAGTTGPYSLHLAASACAAAPVNNECTGAIALTVNPTCQPISGNVLGATQSLPAILCNTFTGDANDDVWYSFVATAANLTITVAGSDSLDAVVELLSNTCGNNVNLDCADATLAGEVETIQAVGLQVGQTYYVRVYDYFTAVPATTTFDICVFGGGGGNPPPNDQCFNVVPGALNVGGQLTFTGTNVGATSTNDAVVGSGLDVAPDTTTVWHAFTTITCANVTLSYCGTTPDFETVWIALAQTCPANQIIIATAADFTTCADSNATILYANLPAGTYYVPVFGNGATQGNYTILATATACGSVPANDDCANVIALPVWTPAECPANATAGDNALATEDGGTASCDSSGVGTTFLDVWYIFNSGPYSTITVNFNQGTMTDWVVVVSDGCSGAELICDITPTAPIVLTVTTFTSYTVRVYSNTDFGAGGAFTICLTGDLGTDVQAIEAVSWSLFPNPSNGSVNLIWPDASAMATVDLLDATGRMVRQQRQMLQQGSNVLVGAETALKPGAYLVRVTTGNARTEQRVIVR